MKVLDKLSLEERKDIFKKCVKAPDVNLYGAYYYDGEDIVLHDEEEIFKDNDGKDTDRLKIVDIVENGIFKKHKEYENFGKGIKEYTDIEYPLEKNEMLIFVMNEGFTKTRSLMMPVTEAINKYKLLLNEEVEDDIKRNEG